MRVRARARLESARYLFSFVTVIIPFDYVNCSEIFGNKKKTEVLNRVARRSTGNNVAESKPGLIIALINNFPMSGRPRARLLFLHRDRPRRVKHRRPSAGEARLIVKDNGRSITPVIAGWVILRRKRRRIQGVIRFPSIKLPSRIFTNASPRSIEKYIYREMKISRQNVTLRTYRPFSR